MVDKIIPILILRDGSKLKNIFIRTTASLQEARLNIGSDIMNLQTKFKGQDNQFIEIELEQQIQVQQILRNGSIQIASPLDQEQRITIIQNGKEVTKIKIGLEESLAQLRIELTKQQFSNFSFVYDDNEISQDDEQKGVTIDDIQQNKKVQIQQANPLIGNVINIKNDEVDDNDYILEGEIAKQLPECAEKALKDAFFLAKYINNLDSSIENSQKHIEKQDLFDQKLAILSQFMKEEDLMTQQIENLLKEVQSKRNIKDWSSIIQNLISIQKQMVAIDIQKLKILLKKVDEAANLIQEKDIILFLGETGADKSTTIHFLSGSKMALTKIHGEIFHIGPSQITNEQAKQIQTSPFAFSVTKFIQPVQLDFPQITLCDTPGFGDSQGVEVDLANSLGVIRALQKAEVQNQSLQLVVKVKEIDSLVLRSSPDLFVE